MCNKYHFEVNEKLKREDMELRTMERSLVQTLTYKLDREEEGLQCFVPLLFEVILNYER